MCRYCGWWPAVHVDHIVPRSRGGSYNRENLAPACELCNLEKCDRTPDEWGLARLAAGKPWPIPSLNARIADLSRRRVISRPEGWPEASHEEWDEWIEDRYVEYRSHLLKARDSWTGNYVG